MMRKKLYKILLAFVVVMNIMVVPISASNDIVRSAQARYNNIFAAELTLAFDKNNIAYCNISLMPYSNCTGLEGYMRLLDSNGRHVASWNLYDYTDPYMIEKTAQVQYGQTYTLTFQGYAYGTGQLFDDIVLSVTATCID